MPSTMLQAMALLLPLVTAQQQLPPDMHVLELHDSEDVTMEQVMGAFKQLGVDPEQATPLVQRVSKQGKAVVVAGPKESLDAAAKAFDAISMRTTVRPLEENDLPGQGQQGGQTGAAAGTGAKPQPSKQRVGEYANSDVIEADTAKLQEIMQDKRGGALVSFYAPWCGHCIKMVPDVKKAATMLKAKGITVAAVNSDNEPGLARSLGIQGFPAVKWVYDGQITDYKGDRTALDLVQFAQQQHAISLIKAKLGEGVGAVKKLGKLAMSKVLGGATGMQPAQQPAAAA